MTLLLLLFTIFRTRDTSGLSLDDNREIRNALFGLVHFYVDRESTYDELNCLLNFMLAVEEEFVVRKNIYHWKSIGVIFGICVDL